MIFYNNTRSKFYTFDVSMYREWNQREVIKYLYSSFVPLLKKLLLNETINNSCVIKDSPFELSSYTSFFNNGFFHAFWSSFEELIMQHQKYGKAYSLTDSAYKQFRFEPRNTLISLCGLSQSPELVPILREISLHDTCEYIREKAIYSLFDIGSPEAILAGFEGALLGGVKNVASRSSILSKIDELLEYQFSDLNEDLLLVFKKYFISPEFVVGLKSNNEESWHDGDDELRIVRHLFSIAIKIGTKSGIDFIFEFGLKSPFVEMQTIAHTALLVASRKSRNDKFSFLQTIKTADREISRSLAITAINNNEAQLFSPNMIGAIVAMKW